MADLIDKSEAELQQLTHKVVMSASRAGFTASVRVGKGVAAASVKAAAALYRALVMRHNRSRESGQVSLRTFTRITDGKRELVNVDTRAVSKELERELRRHGVVWSVETHQDGSFTFHVQGKDAELIQHALTVADKRVDETLARTTLPESERQVDETLEHSAPEPHRDSPALEDAPEQNTPDLAPEQKVVDLAAAAEDRAPRLVEHGAAPFQHKEGAGQSYFVTLERGEGERQTLWGVDLERVIGDSGAQLGDVIDIQKVGSVPVTLPDGTQTHRNSWTAQLREDPQRAESAARSGTRTRDDATAPERVSTRPAEAVTERGEREPVLTRSEQRPERTARDRTRAHLADKIDQHVQQRKAELEQTRTRTKTRTPRHSAPEAPAAPKPTRGPTRS